MQEPGNAQVVLMGMIIVFSSLVILIVMIQLMGFIINKLKKDQPEAASSISGQTNTTATSGDNQKTVAAIAAAIAEDMGTDVEHLKIYSIKRV